MTACEKCWADACWKAAHDGEPTVEHYLRLIQAEHPHPKDESTK